jgi:integrase
MLRWIVRIAIETGMRSSEIATLQRSQVDVKRRVVRLIETKNTLPRTVPLTLEATKLFKEALANPLRPEETDKAWLDIKARMGMKDLKFHDLRHEAVSRFVEAGLSDQEVSAISGHKSMQTLKRYTHLRAEDLGGVSTGHYFQSGNSGEPHPTAARSRVCQQRGEYLCSMRSR